MNVKNKRWVKLVALFIVLTMVLGLIATSLIVALMGNGGNDVVGTYALSDGSKLVLDKDGYATVTIPQNPEPARATYNVENDKVTIEDPSSGKVLVTFKYKDKTLTDTSGQSSDVWLKQK